MATRFSCHSMLSTRSCFAALRSIAMYSYSTLPQSSSCVIHSFLRMWQTLLSALLSYTDLSLSHITFAESLISKCARTSAVVAMYILDLIEHCFPRKSLLSFHVGLLQHSIVHQFPGMPASILFSRSPISCRIRSIFGLTGTQLRCIHAGLVGAMLTCFWSTLRLH